MQMYGEDGTRLERTGWRDQEISKRHRMWGANCPTADIDFLLVEYNVGKPVCLIEYKAIGARMPDTQHATYKALSELADNSKLPFLVVFYWPGIWAFRIYPVNAYAQEHFEAEETLSEYDFVSRLYKLRRFVLSADLSSKLNRALPGQN